MAVDNALLPSGIYENWHQWHRVEHGAGCVASLASEITRLGGDRLFLVTTRSLMREGKLLERVRQAIGRPVQGLFAETTPHTPREVVLAAANAARKAEANCIVSFGGSTVVDTAKGVALALAAGIETDADFDRFRGHAQPPLPSAPPPHIAVPTTLSGAEFSRDIGITNASLRKKEIFRYDVVSPQGILLDPELTEATPQRLWASTGVKVMSDAIEQLYARSTHPVIRTLAVSAIRMFGANLKASEHADRATRLNARLNCQIASWMTLFAMHNANTNVGLGGGLRHQLGGLARIPHGEATCVMLPHVIAFNAPAIPDGYHALAEALDIDTTSLPRDQWPAAVVEQIRSLIGSLGLPDRLEPLGLKRDDIDTLAAHVMTEVVLKFNPREVRHQSEVAALLEAAL